MAYYRSRPTRVGFLFCKLDTPTITNVVPFEEKWRKHGRNREAEGMADRAFWKKTARARSEMRGRWHGRPCLWQKSDKGTVETGGCGSYVTVPFAKKRQRHGRNRGLWGAGDRAFWEKTSKARSKLRGRGRRRPCLLEKNVKGTVEIGDQWAPTS